MDTSFRDWACIAAHIMDLIVIKLELFSDYVRFCGVCPQWRYLALEAKVDHKVNLDLLKASHKKLPMLMFKTDANNDKWRSLYSLTSRVTYDIKLPSPYKYRFAGSSLGWLFYLDKTMVVTLVNPCNNSRISLPVFKTTCELLGPKWHDKCYDFRINKGILLSDPNASPSSFGMVVTYGMLRNLAFFISGDSFWTFVNPESDINVGDIISYKGKLYIVDHGGKFFQIDLQSGTIETIIPESNSFFGRIYLVESQDGDLLMVKRIWRLPGDNTDDEDYENLRHDDDFSDSDSESFNTEDRNDNYVDSDGESSERVTIYNSENDLQKTSKFKVFKMALPIEKGSSTWVEVNNIGKQALFLGDNHSVSVSTDEFPGCLPNSIYYTAENHHGYTRYEYCGCNEDSGIFNLEDGSFSLHHVLDSSSMYMQPPIWFVPNP